MGNPTISVVIATYRRPVPLANTLDSIRYWRYPNLEIVVVEDGDNRDGTEGICRYHSARYICRRSRPDPSVVPFSNPAIPLNIGIRAATGDILVIQGAECTHQNPVIKMLVDQLLSITVTTPEHAGSPAAVFASVSALNESGHHVAWLTHPEHSPRPFFFCGAIHRSIMMHIRGFDEDYLYVGYDDADMAERLTNEGHRFIFIPPTDAIVHHQYHPPYANSELGCQQAKINEKLFESKQRQRLRRDIGDIRNIGREWGMDRNPFTDINS